MSARRPTHSPSAVTPPRSACIVMLSALGDAVRVLPVANALRRAWPDTRIEWLIEPLAHDLVRGHEAVDAFVVVPRRSSPLWRWYRQVRSAVAGRSYDLLLDLQVGLKAGLVTQAVDAEVKLGFDRRRARDGNWLFTNARIPPRPLRHAQAQYFEFLEYLGIDPEPVEWRIRLTDDERAAQSAFFDGLGRTCAVAIGASHPRKTWAPERYARLLEALELERGFRTILVGGPSASERVAAEQILASTAARPLNALRDGVRWLYSLLEGSDLVIAPDSAPLHMAAAAGTPAIGLFGYTNPKRYAPVGSSAGLVVDGYARWPGEDYPESGRSREGGMARVTVEAVLQQVDRVGPRFPSASDSAAAG